MKQITFATIFLLFSFEAFAEAPPYQTPSSAPYLSQRPPSQAQLKVRSVFHPKTYLSIEYSAPNVMGGGVNTTFKTNVFEKQVKELENIALGMHFRTHRFLGFNFNWAQTDLTNGAVQNASLSQIAHFKMDQYNASALFFAPVVENMFDLFAELGVSDMHSRLSYVQPGGSVFDRRDHETMGIYGIGFQFSPIDGSSDAFRFTFQEYTGKLSLLNARYSTVRIGYLKSF